MDIDLRFMSKVADIEDAEKQKMRDKVQKIIAHGINYFVNRQLIYNFPEELFADAGILAIEHADFEGIERLALITGGEIASTFDNPESVKLGHCKVIEEIMIGEDMLIHFTGIEVGQACTIVLRGTSEHVLDEVERSLHDTLCVLSETVNDTRVLFRGGWPEMAEHHKENCTARIDVITGNVGDMQKLGIQESFKEKQAILLFATEAAKMILKVGEIITCAPCRREDKMSAVCLYCDWRRVDV
uniref:T-complex protein 1 subunit beta n=1 Tax=Zea mays TaxID=4577 RepID=A0A804N300_MAIZE